MKLAPPPPAAYPQPASVRYNDWRQVAVEPLDAFTPAMPVSVIIPHYQTPAETLDRTLAALERQTYPRDMFEVIIVDDGSEPPLERLPSATPLDVKIARQERRGFGAARARNAGAREAAHDILLFLDSDMLAEAGWMAAHARWHHAVSDVLTVGFYANVSVDDVEAEAIRRRTGTLRDMFSNRRVDPPWIDANMARTDYLTSKADDLFRVVISGNLGVGKGFFESTRGFDESLSRWEDTEFGYRAYTRGGLLAPLPEAFAWHQGRWMEDRGAKDKIYLSQRGKLAHRIAHPAFRAEQPGRAFETPRHVVSIDAGRCSASQIIAAVANILGDRTYDLAVRIEMPASDDDHERLTLLRDEFGADQRVSVAPVRSALDEFPASPFHIAIPAGVAFRRGVVHRLRAALGDAVTAAAALPDGSEASITRAWALHRARRAGGSLADFGDARTIPLKRLKPKKAGSAKYPSERDHLLAWMRDVRSPAQAWAYLKGLTIAARRRIAIRR